MENTLHFFFSGPECMETNIAAATFIRALHIAFIAWIVYAPFSNNDEFLLMHAIICPFLMLHWLTSSAGCALTLLEKRLRGLEADEHSFIHKIVAPIYVIDDASLKAVVFGATVGLWTVTLSKLVKKYRAMKDEGNGTTVSGVVRPDQKRD